MNNRRILFLAIVAFASSPLLADPSLEREFKQLQEQREKAIAAASEPINQRYRTALEQLLRRATTAGDLETALKFQTELKMSRATAASLIGSPAELREALGDSEWTWERPGFDHKITFSKDGTFKHSSFDGTWQAIGPRSIRLKGAWGEAALTFNDTLTSYQAISGVPHKEGVTGKKK